MHCCNLLKFLQCVDHLSCYALHIQQLKWIDLSWSVVGVIGAMFLIGQYRQDVKHMSSLTQKVIVTRVLLIKSKTVLTIFLLTDEFKLRAIVSNTPQQFHLTASSFTEFGKTKAQS